MSSFLLFLMLVSCSVALAQNVSRLPVVDVDYELHQAFYLNVSTPKSLGDAQFIHKGKRGFTLPLWRNGMMMGGDSQMPDDCQMVALIP